MIILMTGSTDCSYALWQCRPPLPLPQLNISALGHMHSNGVVDDRGMGTDGHTLNALLLLMLSPLKHALNRLFKWSPRNFSTTNLIGATAYQTSHLAGFSLCNKKKKKKHITASVLLCLNTRFSVACFSHSDDDTVSRAEGPVSICLTNLTRR